MGLHPRPITFGVRNGAAQLGATTNWSVSGVTLTAATTAPHSGSYHFQGAAWSTNDYCQVSVVQSEQPAARWVSQAITVNAKVRGASEQTGLDHDMKSSYNMTGCADGGRAGDTDHTFATDFSSAEYCIVTCGENSGVVLADSGGTQAAGTVTTLTSDVNDGGTLIDVEGFMACFGDQ